MTYRIRKRAKLRNPTGEAAYGVDWYKNHNSGHAGRTLAAFARRVRGLDADFVLRREA